MTVAFKPEKATKNTIKFAEITENDQAAPKIGMLYVQKATLQEIGWGEGKELTVDITVKE